MCNLRCILTLVEERAGRLIMPVALQIHHCAADGFHAARLLEDLEQLMLTPHWVAARTVHATLLSSPPCEVSGTPSIDGAAGRR